MTRSDHSSFNVKSLVFGKTNCAFSLQPVTCNFYTVNPGSLQTSLQQFKREFHIENFIRTHNLTDFNFFQLFIHIFP